MVTGGRWVCGTAVSCARAGSAPTADDAVAENIRNNTLRTDMPSHDTLLQSRATAPTQPGPLTLANRV